MTQKRFIKLLIAHGFPALAAKDLVAYMKELRKGIENHENMVLLADSKTATFREAKVYSYEETYKRILEGRDIFV